MKLKDRFYYFFKNLAAFLLLLLVILPYCLCGIIGAAITLTVTDGSEEVAFPWEWKWR